MQPAGGKRRLLRTLAPSGEFVYTRAGKAYFRDHSHFEYVVGVPVKIETTTGRQAGRVRRDVLPVAKLGVTGLLQSQLGTEAARQAQVKARVLRELGVTGRVALCTAGWQEREAEDEALVNDTVETLADAIRSKAKVPA
jgi:hypothetical protein